MRFLYFLLKIILQYPLRLYYNRFRKVNEFKHFFGRTIYVSNHASSFMDPLVVAVLQRPIVFFMTRSDVFKPFTRPLLWSVHMLPIYREQDGVDTQSKNKEVFKKCTQVLRYGRNLLIFGEGFTDDVFIRRLKPVKKGAARIGFGTLEALNWEKKIYMAAIGVNYGDPNYLGSDLLISSSDRFCLNDYKDAYLENPAKVITEVTKRIETLMQEQITHVENKDWVFFHEQICRLRRNGLHPQDSNLTIPIRKRWENSRKLALWMNSLDLEANPDLVQLKNDTDQYFKLQKRMKLEERFVSEVARHGSLNTSHEKLRLIFFSPFVLPGLVSFGIPYLLVKRFTEKSFKRRVFWSSVKMMLGLLAMALWNMPLIWLLNHFLIQNALASVCLYLILPMIGMITYEWFRQLKDYKTKQVLRTMKLDDFVSRRKELLERINTLITD